MTKSCGCLLKETTSKRRYKGAGTLSGTRWKNICRDAVRRNLSVEITIEQAWSVFESQSGRCAVSGLPITLNRSARTPGTASLDRRDNSKGYVPGNVWWVHTHVNQMKWDHDLDYFIELCRTVASHQGEVNG